jgi:hypothetical protein
VTVVCRSDLRFLHLHADVAEAVIAEACAIEQYGMIKGRLVQIVWRAHIRPVDVQNRHGRERADCAHDPAVSWKIRETHVCRTITVQCEVAVTASRLASSRIIDVESGRRCRRHYRRVLTYGETPVVQMPCAALSRHSSRRCCDITSRNS